MNTQKKTKGFTIIEVVLVLAIAGLIFLMVFLALPALQRSQRDTQRKTDLGKVQTAINNYQSNNKGGVPGNNKTELDAFVKKYLAVGGDAFIDPLGANTTQSGSTYEIKPNANSPTIALPTLGSDSYDKYQNTIYYTPKASCGSDGAFVAASSRVVSVSIYLEGGGIACLNN